MDDPSYYLDLEVPCRLCPNCLRARRNLWAFRAKSEYQASSRTWFGTLTLRPEEHFKCVATFESEGREFRQLSADECFAVRHRIISRWITLYLKRVRKETGANMRCLFVAEKHKTGLPHYHALIHEVTADDVVRKAVLQKQWWHGFSAFKLITDEKPLWYVAKYLGKDSCARVRASIRYGQRSEIIDQLQPQGGRLERVGCAN